MENNLCEEITRYGIERWSEELEARCKEYNQDIEEKMRIKLDELNKQVDELKRNGELRNVQFLL